uniref:General transcription factor III repeat domaincontaining protein 2like [Oreochromis niloticus] n=1 Tax=Lepeophtheirus salmonis TaxID=72036 RepID=A0A0K2TDA8_LEPSM
MNADKKHKIEDESRVFNKERTAKCYFTKFGNKVVCLLCIEYVVVSKEYNITRHDQTKHANFEQNFTSEERKQRCQELVNKLNKRQTVFTKQSTIQDVATETSFLFSYKLDLRKKFKSDSLPDFYK